MRYQSNLRAPDIAPYFRLLNPPKQMAGHDAPSDPDYLPDCTFLTHDEAAILYHIAKRWPGHWADIGARFGWTATHIAATNCCTVDAVDPDLRFVPLEDRFLANTNPYNYDMSLFSATSEEYFAAPEASFGWFDQSVWFRLEPIVGAMIDGCHDSPEPTLDAKRAIYAGAQVLVWHDFQGRPVRDAVNEMLSDPYLKWNVRVYWTPNMMAVAWCADCGFVPPDHVRDQAINWEPRRAEMAEDFDFGLCV